MAAEMARAEMAAGRATALAAVVVGSLAPDSPDDGSATRAHAKPVWAMAVAAKAVKTANGSAAVAMEVARTVAVALAEAVAAENRVAVAWVALRAEEVGGTVMVSWAGRGVEATSAVDGLEELGPGRAAGAMAQVVKATMALMAALATTEATVAVGKAVRSGARLAVGTPEAGLAVVVVASTVVP